MNFLRYITILKAIKWQNGENMNLSLPYDITCGYFDCSEFAGLTISPCREVAKFEIEYYLADGLTTTTNGVEYPVKKDYIRIAIPGQHVFSRLPFYTMYLKFSVDGILAKKFQTMPQYFAAVNTHKIKDLLGEVIRLYDDKNQELLFNSKLLEVLHVIISDSLLSNTPKNINVKVVETAKKYVDENYSQPITLSDIAMAVSLSPNHFHTVFKATYQMTPHEYLISKRISAAKEMLWNTQIGISEIAEKCGFGCQQYFSEVFKKEVGITPGKYRKTLQQNYFI